MLWRPWGALAKLLLPDHVRVPKTWGFGLAKISRTTAWLLNDICKVIPAMNIGYARVSTDDQDLKLQLQTLKGANCRRTYQEKKIRRAPTVPNCGA
jgi:hypothetical protein